MAETKAKTMTATKLERIAKLSGENPRMEFIGLMPHVWSSPKKVDTFLRTTPQAYGAFTLLSREKNCPPPRLLLNGSAHAL